MKKEIKNQKTLEEKNQLAESLISCFGNSVKNYDAKTARSYYPYDLLMKAIDNKLTRIDKDRIFKNLNENAFFKTAIPVMGYAYYFFPFLKTYYVKLRNQGVFEMFAPDATSIRNYYGNHQVLKIVLVD